MITVRLQGGLGNQLFQWAFGLAASTVTGQPVQFDAARLYRRSERLTPRELRLPAFDPQANVIRLGRMAARLSRKGWSVLPGVPDWIEEGVLEPGSFEPLVGRTSLVTGFFQSEQWFLPAAQLIRQRLRSARQRWLAQSGQPALDQLLPGAVGLHVRRGDYIKLAHVHPPVDETYIRTALELFPAQCPVFVCSDDLSWARQAVATTGREVIFEAGDDLDDFFRLSLCGGKIISNSTFSWWSAWLDDEPPGNMQSPPAIVRPTPWYAGDMAASPAEALICPERWQKAQRGYSPEK